MTVTSCYLHTGIHFQFNFRKFYFHVSCLYIWVCITNCLLKTFISTRTFKWRQETKGSNSLCISLSEVFLWMHNSNLRTFRVYVTKPTLSDIACVDRRLKIRLLFVMKPPPTTLWHHLLFMASVNICCTSKKQFMHFYQKFYCCALFKFKYHVCGIFKCSKHYFYMRVRTFNMHSDCDKSSTHWLYNFN